MDRLIFAYVAYKVRLSVNRPYKKRSTRACFRDGLENRMSSPSPSSVFRPGGGKFLGKLCTVVNIGIDILKQKILRHHDCH